MNEGQCKNNMGLARRRFSLFEIYREIVDEVFDFNNISKYKLTPNFEGWEFSAELNDETVPVYIYIQETNVDRFSVPPKFKNAKVVVNLGFEIGHSRSVSQYTKSSYREYVKILATVGDALKEYISKKHPDIITFFSESKHGGMAVDSQKDDVYFKALDRNKPSGYEIDTIFDNIDKKLGIMLYRKTLIK